MRTFILLSVIALAAAGTVDKSLMNKAKAGERFDAVLTLPSIIDEVVALKSISTLSGDAKVNAMVSTLEAITTAAQAPFMAVLEKLRASSKASPIWISNKIGLENIDAEILNELLAVEGDFHIREPIIVTIDPIVVNTNITAEEAAPKQGNAQWGVAKIRADKAWSVTRGEGVVVGIIDTGANLAHVALKDNYAGAWSDPYYNRAPTDANGHGSHALGSIVGTANGVGVAPGARWIACRGLNDQGSGSDVNLSKCAQFMLTANPRPKVVSNSWGGGQGSTWYSSEVTAWRNANIVPVFAIGNAGAACRTANSPGDGANLISVGATTSTDAMASFSSRGPSVSGGRMKPELSAPGNAIVSCGTGTNNYATLSGTSMATPHVAGAVALILSKNPNYTFAQVQTALTSNAVHPTLTNADRNCGVSGGSDWPNNAFGAGRIDVGKSLGV